LAATRAAEQWNGRSGDHVLLAPPYIASSNDIDMIVDRLGQAVDSALKKCWSLGGSANEEFYHCYRFGYRFGSLQSFSAASAAYFWIRSNNAARWCAGSAQALPASRRRTPRENYKGLDVDYCRALAAGVLGDPSKVRYVALTAQNRFTALQSGEIDVLYRNSTQTYLRGVTLGLRQGPVNFYDGQGFVVKSDSGVKDLKGLNGATVCVAQGTTHEVTLGDYGRANGIEWKPLVFESHRYDVPDLLRRPLRCHDPGRVRVGRCRHHGGVESRRFTRAAADHQQGAARPVHPQRRRSLDRHHRRLHYGLVEAEELGVTKANADEMTKSTTPAIQRLLGAAGELGSRLGLDNKWMLQAIKAGGNYGEIFEAQCRQGKAH